jgi:hypothetical protein
VTVIAMNSPQYRQLSKAYANAPDDDDTDGGVAVPSPA